MKRNELRNPSRSKEMARLCACLPSSNDRDLLRRLVCSRPDHALSVLQRCFGCDVEEAKAAWNDYVLRHVDGSPQARPQCG